jgi:hypothetical protein
MSTRTALASVAEEEQGFFSPNWLLRASERHLVFSQVLDSRKKERKKEKRSELTRRKSRATTCDSSSGTDQFSHGDARRNSFNKARAN